ncbi:MAG TPA: exodeoxyribonuclease V subunit beta [Candidatus Margulisiibacteriota bacterium]|nr:exodeoxyribonuclease V subunit beta [Candidatus Margulisiibacteriota bacterium]
MTRLDPLTVPLRGTTLIEASAGTGKTQTITTLYVRLLIEGALLPSDILVVTYTNAATAELRARVRRRIRDALAALDGGGSDDATLQLLVAHRQAAGTLDADRRALTAALYAFDEAAIFTIHGFCQRILQEHAFESGAPFDAQLVTDPAPLRDEVVRDFWAREIYAASEPFVRYLQDQKVTPARLTRLAQTVVAHPDMPVLPEQVAAMDGTLAIWQRAAAHAAAVWRAARDQIVDLLETSEALGRNRYPSGTIRTQWAPAIDAELAAPRPGISTRLPKIEKLTTTAIAQGTKKRCTPPAHPFFDACEALCHADETAVRALGNQHLRLQLDLVHYARHEVPWRHLQANTQSFDDLLHRLDEALAGPAGAPLAARIRSRFRAALIDEFQDTDPVQYDIFRRIYHSTDGSLFLIGDPKQAIYAFRGADVFTYIQSRRDAGAHTYTLATNWRSAQRLVAAVNTLFAQAHDPFVLGAISFQPVDAAPGAQGALGGGGTGQAPLQFLFARPRDERRRINKGSGFDDVTRAVAAEIVRVLTSGTTVVTRQAAPEIGPGDIAVLCRTNAQAAGMQAALRALRVPSVLHGDASVFDAPEAAELERVLRGLADPRDPGAVRAALATTLMGVSANELFALQANEREWDVWLRRFQSWHDLWRRRGFVPAFRQLLDELDAQPRLLTLVDGERRMTNLLHLGELLHTALSEAQRGPLALVEWLHLLRRDRSARADLGAEAAQIRLESDDRAVQLVTIHKSKGLEYPIVFCPYLWDGTLLHDEDAQLVRFHDPDHDDRLTLDIGSAAHAAHVERATQETLAENLRLLYVALTRAKCRCYVVWGPFNTVETSALGYLLHQPPTPVPATALARATAERIAGLDAAGLRADLDRLVAASEGSIGVTDLNYAPVAPFTQAEQPPETLRCRTATRPLHAGWRISSFSGLAARGALSRSAEEGLDRDELTEADAVEALPIRQEEQVLIVLHDFPTGVRAGLLMHEVLQHLDFQCIEPLALRAQLAVTLQRNGFEMDWADALGRAVTDVVGTPLEPQLRLRDIPLNRRLNELEFIFPVANAAPHTMLTAARVADIFNRHGTQPLPRDYAGRVRCLGFAPLAGYLRGFIDLAFEHAGRWYVVDYKSNLLGVRPEDYRPSRLVDAMVQHHYFLQYHLYAVALHRHLAMRLRNYDYDEHFGGVYYLFLRGMAPQYAPGCGVFRDRPPRSLIEALSALLSQPAGDEGEQ